MQERESRMITDVIHMETPSFGLETNEQILLWFSWTMRGSRLDLQKRQNGEMVGARGFEPPTPWSRTRCATRLRYAPMFAASGGCRRSRRCGKSEGAICG